MLYVLLGKSGSGKDSIIHEMGGEVKRLPMFTSRPKRPNEGDTYYFLNEDNKLELECGVVDMSDSVNILEQREYNTVHGVWKYGTIAHTVKNDQDRYCELWNSKKDDYIVATSIAQAKNYLIFPRTISKGQIIVIYLDVADEVLMDRVTKRDKVDSEEATRRLEADKIDYDYDTVFRILAAADASAILHIDNKNTTVGKITDKVKHILELESTKLKENGRTCTPTQYTVY